MKIGRSQKIGLFVACLLPFAALFYGAGTGGLGPDPAEHIMHVTGEWALRILALTLLASPLRTWFGWQWLLRNRRMLGLYVFFYASIHLMSFAHFYVGWTPGLLLEELWERPYITLGFAAWILMLPLAVTSSRYWQRRLKRRWVALHSLVYPASVLACLHLLWLARSDLGDVLVYALVFASLLLWRLRRARYRQRGQRQSAQPTG